MVVIALNFLNYEIRCLARGEVVGRVARRVEKPCGPGETRTHDHIFRGHCSTTELPVGSVTS